MNISRYEIDVLGVNDAEAILLHFFDDDNGKEHIILFDAGNESNGKKIVDFIKQHYTSHQIDLAFCTHCDKDHYGGFQYLLSYINSNQNKISKNPITIERMIFNIPVFSKDENINNLYKFSDGTNLIDLLDSTRIKLGPGFSDKKWDNPFPKNLKIISPSNSFFHENEKKLLKEKNISFKSIMEGVSKSFSKKDIDDFPNDDSISNMLSICVLFEINKNKKLLFTGDMEETAFENIADNDKDLIKNVYFLKVPHHGSPHNVKTEILKHYNPRKAIVSVSDAKLKEYQPTIDFLKKEPIKCEVFSTHGSSNFRHYSTNMPSRDGYKKAISL